GTWIHGLKVVAVAVVAQAVWGMAKSLCPDRHRASIAVAAAVFLIAMPTGFGQIITIVLGGVIGWWWLSPQKDLPASHITVSIGNKTAITCLLLFFALLFVLPLLAHSSHTLALFDSFYRSGALVFGGGHVVLPLIQAEVVPTGWVSESAFTAGYGAAQAVPGPLFTFAAYLGAVSTQAPNGWLGATIATLGIFAPAFLLVFGTLPLWQKARQFHALQKAMMGVNAAVVGVLLAAFYNPVWTSAILSPKDFALAITALLLLNFWKAPPWLVVILCALAAGLGWH
ncbi:MAG: chromate efflux transporter, partial [Pseudomonadales bacterium]|nr:chromate efflux transporter [Pseudomonadales bacterium]